MPQRILVTGGAGFIGSHTCVELLEGGHEVVVVDNLCNSSEESLARVRELTGKDLVFAKVDLLHADALEKVFSAHAFDAVIHFAALKAVGESHGVKDFVFSSSATVYGDPASVPITEDFPLQATNPYGRTKYMMEEILRDVAMAEEGWRIILLRYFNPVGAHPSGRIGEDPRGIPNNLMPFIMQVAVGRRKHLDVFGDDYPTADGTGVRDYIHVVDLAQGHLAALAALPNTRGCAAYNLGTGRGHTVLEVVRAAEKASGKRVPHRVVARRPGDIAACWADPALATATLQWQARLGLDAMCADAWRWQSQNPDGYR